MYATGQKEKLSDGAPYLVVLQLTEERRDPIVFQMG